ncbi:energy transducer TonB [Segetibacter aerophilus]|nr:energy transducer TonB [Segetibacter aerophilus]
MEVDKIMKADLLDILFEGKNKDYGAYELRKTYDKRITWAMSGMSLFCLVFFLTQVLANEDDKPKRVINITELHLNNLKPDKAPDPIPVQPPKSKPIPVAVSHFTKPIIVTDDLVKDPPPDIDRLENTRIGLANQDGTKDDSFVAPPLEQSISVVEGPKKQPEEDYEKVFFKVEKEARFPGGMQAWKKYLERNLNANVAADDGAPTGFYTVKVQFVVDKEGGISNVQAIEVPKACPTCGPEAVKIIKKGPKWEPAIQNDRKVNYQAIQFVTFQVAEE